MIRSSSYSVWLMALRPHSPVGLSIHHEAGVRGRGVCGVWSRGQMQMAYAPISYHDLVGHISHLTYIGHDLAIFFAYRQLPIRVFLLLSHNLGVSLRVIAPREIANFNHQFNESSRSCYEKLFSIPILHAHCQVHFPCGGNR